MDPIWIGAIAIIGLLLLMAKAQQIGAALLIVSFVGYALLGSFQGASLLLGTASSVLCDVFPLACVPLFILMGEFLMKSDFTGDIFDAASCWLGWLPGGLAIGSVAGCAVLAAANGSTQATAAGVGKVAVPEMLKRGYDPSLATACVAAAGTLGVMIPPSVGMVLYAVVAGQSLGALLLSGILPGILLALCFIAAVLVQCLANPRLSGPTYRASWIERIRSLTKIWPLLVLGVIVMGSIYAGLCTPTEAAALGACGALFLGLAKGRLSLRSIQESLMGALITTATVMFVVFGALFFSRFLVFVGFADAICKMIAVIAKGPGMFILLVVPIYLVAGCLVDGSSIILITVPILLPAAVAVGVDPIWFGVFVVLMTEIGCITPPVAVNVWVVASIVPEIEVGTIYRGILPFVIAALFACFVLFLFPEIALFYSQ